MLVATKCVVWATFLLGTAVGAACVSVNAADTNPSPASLSPPQTLMSDADWAALFDQSKPLADRQNMLARVEQSPDLRNPKDLYMLGSLYHMGKHAPGSPVDADPQKASLYLGNAAIRGSVYAMAKMAELKLSAGQYHEAMNWAQIYSHYALLSPNSSYSPRESYAAELVSRIKDHVGDAEMPGIMKDVDSFVALNDAQIRAGMKARIWYGANEPHRTTHHRVEDPTAKLPHTGIADYIVAFKPDGTVASAQLIDAVPQPNVGVLLRPWVESITLKPVKQSHALRYAWVPLVMGNQQYRMEQ